MTRPAKTKVERLAIIIARAVNKAMTHNPSVKYRYECAARAVLNEQSRDATLQLKRIKRHAK